jgi:hypothetical protein
MSMRVLARKETERVADGEPVGLRCGTPVAVGAAAVDLAFGDTVEFRLGFVVAGDCKVVVENAKREPLFHFWFNTSMINMNTDGKAVLNLSKVALDGALAKDKSSKLVQESFRIELLMVRCKDKEKSSSKEKDTPLRMATSATAAASRGQRSMSVLSTSAAAAPTAAKRRPEALSDDNKSDNDDNNNNNDDDETDDSDDDNDDANSNSNAE